MRFVPRIVAALALTLAGQAPCVADDGYFSIEARIDLPGVRGRIDHLAYDAAGRRLFVAELGNDSIDVVDVAARTVLHHIAGLREPQGIAWSPTLGRMYVAGSDGTVKAFSGADYSLLASAHPGNDADNLRLDESANRLYVGYGDGAIAVLDAATLRRVGEIGLEAHPESFELAPGARLFVNVPAAQEVAVADRAQLRQVASWPSGDSHANYPLALDLPNHRVLVVFRRPASIAAYRMEDGKLLGKAPACADADDLLLDPHRQHIYVICGDGFVDVLDNELARVGRVHTESGARTGLYSPQADRLFVAARALGETAAQVWVLAPGS
jgi:YVTN family beta-propeller protein